MLSLTRSSEHAIRALTYLAQQAEGEFVLGSDVASELGIPAPFLVKVLRPLVSRGLLDSQRGRGGGFRLAVDARDVDLLSIVDAHEDVRDRRCLLGQAECSDERACPLHERWKGTWEGLVQRLEGTTIDDLVRFAADRPAGGYPFPLRVRAKRRRR